jgi:hypothetical protein
MRLRSFAVSLSLICLISITSLGAASSQSAIAISELIRLDIIHGDSTGALPASSQEIDHAKFISLLSRSLRLESEPLPVPEPSPRYREWYSSSVAAANAYLIVPSLTQDQIKQPVSREEAATLSMRGAFARHLIRPGAVPASPPPFADEAAIDPNSRTASHQAVLMGFMSVGPDNRFRPTSAITFGETAELIVRINDLYTASQNGTGGQEHK